MERGTTLREYLAFLSPAIAGRKTPPAWPPDVFAVAAGLLHESGAYLALFDGWPPQGPTSQGCLPCAPAQWVETMHRLGLAWRRGYQGAPPREVAAWWRTLLRYPDLQLRNIRREEPVVRALLHLLAAADEACRRVGTPSLPEGEFDPFWLEAYLSLLPVKPWGSTLGREIDPSKLRVLPKFHTPQSGMTLRSLSHNLALWSGADVSPLWFSTELPRPAGAGRRSDPHSLSLLLVPWPARTTPRDFVASVPNGGRMRNMPEDRFGFFTYRRDSKPEEHLERLQKIYAAALELTDRVDGVILPELALTPAEYEVVRAWVMQQGSFLLAGLGQPAEGEAPGVNQVVIDLPTGTVEAEPSRHNFHFHAFQNKHHRWRIDRSQIVQYGLGGRLDPSKLWWEHTEARSRNLTFVSVLPWLSLCALVCEDLAQQDPVAQLVRVVGPNLVVALLMDGPQLASRWPARYATVLADDPGSSVLTFTGIGMCELSRPPGRPVSRKVALWKDARSGDPVEIELPAGADAILLNLVRHLDEEWTADGRSDGKAAGYPALAGIHPVRVERP
jgi:hypothetical protein